MALSEAFREESRYPVRGIFQLCIFENTPADFMNKNALDLLNPKFTLHVVGALRDGDLHFNELIRQLGMTTNTLRNRLRMLAREGIVIRKVLNDLPPSVSYRLTDKGKALADIVKKVEDWDRKWTGKHPDQPKRAVVQMAAESRKPYAKRRKVS